MMETIAAESARYVGMATSLYEPFAILVMPLFPMTPPVTASMTARIIAATHSKRSCPYGCFLSAFLEATFTPIITIRVDKTSDAECIASDIIAYEFPIMPAMSLKTVSARFTPMLTTHITKAVLE